MSRRGRLRRRGNVPVGSTSNGAAVKSAIVAPVSRADLPPRAGIPERSGIPTSSDAHQVKLPPAEVNVDASSTMSGLEVEVPIDLGTELRLAAAAMNRVADKEFALPSPAALRSDVPSSSQQVEPDMHERLLEHFELEAVDAGLGPIDGLLQDSTVTDILVTGVHDIYVERAGKLARTNASFRDDEHLLTVIDRIVSRVGRHVDESSPIVDARLPDGSRVNAIVPPLALDGPVLSIRRFGSALDIEALAANATLTRRMTALLAACVHARLNILIAGGSGSGKTTLLNALGAFIPTDERVVTIEDAPELRLKQEHVVRLETRAPNIDGRGEVEPRDLVRHALRMRPTRFIFGDLRGAEAADMLQAMNTGHEGSMAAVHASSPRDALARLENMALRGSADLTARTVREQIAATIDLVVQVARLSDGRRRVVSIAEVAGIEGDVIKTNEIFAFHRAGVLGGRVLGRFVATGVRPRFVERLEVAGATLPAGLFDTTPEGDDARFSRSNGSDATNGAGHPAVTSVRHIGDHERHAREVRQLETKVRALEVALEQEQVATQDAMSTVEEVSGQLVAARLEIDVMKDEVRAARYEADEQRELQAMLQQRSRSLAMAVTGFVEVLDDLLDAARESVDEVVRDRAVRLRDAATRLLALFGLSEITGVGTLVDEKQHEVMHRVSSDAHASGVIVAVVQRGFAYHGQTVRRAQVLAAE